MQKSITLETDKLLRYLAVAAVGFLLGVVQPIWGNSKVADRTTTVDGTATISAAPDKFTFSPFFKGEAKTQKAARDEAEKTGAAAVEKLKELGVSEASIKTDLNSYEDYDCISCDKPTGYNANYTLTVVVNDQELAQSVYDYLLDTSASGQISPFSSFSEDKQQELKSQARSQAVANARTQAEQIAGELSAKIGDAISIEEVSGFDFGIPYFADSRLAMEGGPDSASSEFQPGEQDLTFTVKAVFELK